MTVIEVAREGALPVGVKAYGHSGYAEAGSDIVCAAVSALMQTLYIGLADVLGIKPFAVADEGGALMEIRWAAGSDRAQNVLAESIIRALRETSRAYGGYVKFVEVSL